MADEKILISVDVDVEKLQRDLSTAIETVARLKEEQKNLRKEIESGNDTNGTMAKRLTEVTAELEKNQRQVKSQTAVMQAAVSQGIKQNASLDEQRQYLNTLQKAYANLSGEAKALADVEGGMRDQIKQLTESVKEQEHAIGQDGRNVGNYAESIKKALGDLGPMKGVLEGVAGGTTKLSQAVDSVDKVSKGFAANPLFATIMILSSVLTLIANELRKNEEAMDGINTLTASIGSGLSALKPVLDWLMKYLVDGLLAAINWVTDAIKSILKWVDKVADKFGKSLNLSTAFELGAKAAQQETEVTAEELAKQEELRKKHAEEIAKQREEMAKRRRSDMENEIAELEKKHDQEKSIAGLTADEKLQIDEYYQEQINQVRQRYHDEELKRIEEEQRKRDEEAAKEAEREKQKIEARQRVREEFGLDPAKSPEQSELDALQIARDSDLLNAEEYEIAKTMIQQKYADERSSITKQEVEQATRLYEESVKQTGQSAASAFQALSNLLGEYADESKEAAAAQKAFAMGAIIINQAMSIAEGAKGIAAAMAGAAQAAAATGPAAPFTLIAYQAQMVGQVLAVIASVASTIVQAKQTFAQADKYASGGIIPGQYDGRDTVPAMLSKGEMVLNPKQQASLFAMANDPSATGFAYERMAAAIRDGMAAAPAPQVAVKEINEMNARVTQLNEIASI